MTAPQVGQIRAAETLTKSGRPGQSVRIEVTAVEGDYGPGWVVWGHRQYRSRRVGVRQTMYPRQYFIPKEAANQQIPGGGPR